MKPEQLQACAARLPARERAEFNRLHRQAADLIARGWDLRRAAWRIYAPFRPRARA